MSTKVSIVEYIEEQLLDVPGVRSRKVFGGEEKGSGTFLKYFPACGLPPNPPAGGGLGFLFVCTMENMIDEVLVQFLRGGGGGWAAGVAGWVGCILRS